MGMDLYGINPKTKTKAPKRPEGMYEEGVPQPSAEAIDKYYSELHEYQQQEGTYFRNNVWWWRPLAEYIIDHTKCVDEKDRDEWHSNGGHEVDEQQANAIADQLEHLLKTGHVETFAHDYEQERKECAEYNDKVDVLFQRLREKVKKETGKDLAPADYPKADHDEWERLYKKLKHTANYPFTVDNVKEFISFARNSGGFRIC